MNENLENNRFNKILLKPRFKMSVEDDPTVVIEKFKSAFMLGGSQFIGKVVDHHIIIDMAESTQHFWSPQLHVEVEANEEEITIVKGLFGPKPTVWSLFMFVHFAVALAFIVFLVIAYSRWSLGQAYSTAVFICGSMPIVWFILYFFARIGIKKGRDQMRQLHNYFFQILEK